MDETVADKPVPAVLEELADDATTMRVYPPDADGRIIVELYNDSRDLLGSALADTEAAAIDAIVANLQAHPEAAHEDDT